VTGRDRAPAQPAAALARADAGEVDVGVHMVDRVWTVIKLRFNVRLVSAQRDGVLAGFRVIELGNYVAAPTAGRLLAAFGADVVKVERPGTGDELGYEVASRQWLARSARDRVAGSP
jgi:hypothetical protein